MDNIPLWSVDVPAADGTVFSPYLVPSPLPESRTCGRPAGCVIICPGGGYVERAPHEDLPVAKRFNELGFHAFVLEYRVAPYRFPYPLLDARRAVKIVRSRAAEFGIAPDKIAIGGFSAGGHLALSAGLSDDIGSLDDAADAPVAAAVSALPDAVMGFYPVVNLTTPLGHQGSGAALFGDRQMTEGRMFDLENRVSPSFPPAFLWHTADDSCVSIYNTSAFARAMWAAGRPCEIHVFPHGPHGIGLGDSVPGAEQWSALAANFLRNTCGFPASER